MIRTRSASVPASESGGAISTSSPHRPLGVVPHVDRVQRRAGPQRQDRRAGRHLGRLAEEGHLDPGAEKSRSASSGTTVPGPDPVGEHVERRPVTAGQRQDLHAERLTVGEEAPVDALRLEPLGDRGERPAVGRDPGAGRVPVARVRQREHHALAPPRDARAARALVGEAGSFRGSVPRSSSTAAGKPPSSTGRRSAARRASADRTRLRACPGRPPGAGSSRAGRRRRPALATARSAPARKSRARHPAAAAAAPGRQPATYDHSTVDP